MHVAGDNINEKSWYFTAQDVQVEVIEDKSQQINLNLKLQEQNIEMLVTLVLPNVMQIIDWSFGMKSISWLTLLQFHR